MMDVKGVKAIYVGYDDGFIRVEKSRMSPIQWISGTSSISRMSRTFNLQ